MSATATRRGEGRLCATAWQLVVTGGITPHLETGRLARGLGDVPEEAATAKTGEMLIDAPTERVLAQAWRVFERLATALEQHGAGLDDVLRLRIFLRDRRDLTVVERVLAQLMTPPWPTASVIVMRGHGLDPELDVQLDAIALARHGPLIKQVLPGRACGGRPGFAAATRAGPLLFAGNLVGVNPATGQPARSIGEIAGDHPELERFRFVEDREQRILAQSWFIFEHLGQLLAAHGGSIDGTLKVNGWLAFPMRDYGPLIFARKHHFKGRTLPASTGLSIGGVVPDGAELSYDVIALVDGEPGYVKTALPASAIGRFYTEAVSAGPYVLTCGEVPIDLAVPAVVKRLADLRDGAGLELADGTLHADSGVEARSWYVYRRLEEHLGRLGATLRDVVQQTVYLSRVDEYRAFERVSRLFFDGCPPPTTLVPITDTSPFRDAEMEIDMIAYTGGSS